MDSNLELILDRFQYRNEELQESKSKSKSKIKVKIKNVYFQKIFVAFNSPKNVHSNGVSISNTNVVASNNSGK